MEANDPTIFMRAALELAKKAWGKTHPNPMVGAVIVEDGTIVAKGWHAKAGEPHAEVRALRDLGRAPADGATLYITLEPCCTTGKTGACTAAIIESGIKHVVVGACDPNPSHAGRGLDTLRSAGITVTKSILESECLDLNRIFNHWIVTKEPFIAAKFATTVTGQFGLDSRDSGARYLTGEAARQDVMRWRSYFPAIAVSASTLIKDDPALTIRLEGKGITASTRIVLDRSLETLSHMRKAKVFTDAHRDQTIVVCAQNAQGIEDFKNAGIQIWELPEKNGHLDWSAFKARCASENIYGVYLETGPRLTRALIANQAVDFLFHYLAPMNSIGDRVETFDPFEALNALIPNVQLTDARRTDFDADVLISGHLKQ